MKGQSEHYLCMFYRRKNTRSRVDRKGVAWALIFASLNPPTPENGMGPSTPPVITEDSPRRIKR